MVGHGGPNFGSLNDSQSISIFISYHIISYQFISPVFSLVYQSQIARKLLATTFLIFSAWPCCCCQSSIFCKRLSFSSSMQVHCRYILRYKQKLMQTQFRLELLIFLEKPIDVFVRLACEHSSGWGGTLPDGVASQILRVENIWSANVLFSGKQKTIGLTSRSKKGECVFCCCLTRWQPHGMRMPAVCPW